MLDAEILKLLLLWKVWWNKVLLLSWSCYNSQCEPEWKTRGVPQVVLPVFSSVPFSIPFRIQIFSFHNLASLLLWPFLFSCCSLTFLCFSFSSVCIAFRFLHSYSLPSSPTNLRNITFILIFLFGPEQGFCWNTLTVCLIGLFELC